MRPRSASWSTPGSVRKPAKTDRGVMDTLPDRFTIDAFHRGRFWLKQPAGKGHRSGMDAMMLAACVPAPFSGRLADLGAGAGAAGLAVVSRCPGATAVLVERSPEMAQYARETLNLPQNNPLAERAHVIEADVTLTGKARVAAGLDNNAFDFAIANPPFNAVGDRRTPDTLKAEAHVMTDDLLEKWSRTAAAIVKPGGGMALIARPVSLAEVLAAMRGRFGKVEIMPIHPHRDAPAIRIIARGIRGSRAPLSLVSPLVLHDTGPDHFSSRAEAIINGRASLFGD